MNRTNHRSRGYYSRYLAHYTKKNYPLLALGALFAAGVLLGTLLIRTAGGDTLEILLRLTGSFLEKRREQTMLQNFFSSLSASSVFVAALFLCGFCAISQPAVVATPFFRGLGVGFSLASLYAGHGTAAVGFVGILMLPGILLTTVAILICCRESLRLAGSFFRCMGSEKPSQEFYPLRVYFARYFSCVILCVISAFLEAALYFGFANSFKIG